MSCNSFIPLSLKDAERGVLDKEIAELERRLQVLRSKRNRLSPIALLPPELLTRIFFLVRARQAGWKAYEWTAVTHICQRWRTVALGASTLWSEIISSNDGRAPQSAALAAFHRSGKCRIDVDISQDYSPRQDLSFIFTTLADLSRIRTLRLLLQADFQSMKSPELQKLAVFLRTPAPVLEELTLMITILTPGEEEDSLKLGFENDLTWFDGVSPRLRSLILTYSPSDLIGFHGQYLTNLELRSALSEVLPRISFSTLLRLLSEAKKLQTLTLDNAFSLEHSAPMPGLIGRVSLEALSSSTLTFDLPELLHFLANVSVPSTSQTRVVITSFGELQEILEALTSYFLDGIQPIFMMKYTLRDDLHLELELWTTCSADTVRERYLTLVLPLDMEHASFSGLEALPISRIQSLHLAQRNDNFSFPDVGQIFGWCQSLDDLTNLVIEDDFVDFFIEVVKENTNCFPALTILAVCLSIYEPEAYQLRTLDHLYEILEERARLVKPMKLQRLLLANLGDYEASSSITGRIEKFKGLVLQMEVDAEVLWQ
ncbi:hypothetical protein BDN72DRAFT_959014 [Pluteus cervinus]|uniref:Uncharacterized protein n=1 Tax=Pluteus cervinus TaxID=181527 RepID=A0ACD3AWT7_9AGAR|nr:hypothetical protein BDN72DRAFT_959014 [Pluteus cervinus]